MSDYRRVTDGFSVTSQLQPQEVAEAAAQGFRLLINNRPDGEVAGQPSAGAVAEAARAAGMDYVHIPISGPASAAEIKATRDAIAAAKGPVLAFCRSGTRSITVWAKSQAAGGERSREELVGLGREAGYDLSGSL